MIVDEIGYLPTTRTGTMLVFQLLTRRYEQAGAAAPSEDEAIPHDVAGYRKVLASQGASARSRGLSGCEGDAAGGG